MMPKRKKTTASGELAVVKSVRQNAQPQIENLCSKGAWGYPSTSSAREPWLSWGIACRYYP